MEHENAGKNLQQEVLNAWVNVRTLREQIVALTAEVTAAREVYEDTVANYQQGLATSLDAQIGLRDLNNARTLLESASFDYQIALRNLRRADGSFQNPRVVSFTSSR